MIAGIIPARKKNSSDSPWWDRLRASAWVGDLEWKYGDVGH
jgi:hypothetical protein